MGKKRTVELEQREKEFGTIEIPIKRVENALCLRFHLASAKTEKGEWNIGHSGGAIIVDIPKDFVAGKGIAYFYITLEDIIRACIKKVEGG